MAGNPYHDEEGKFTSKGNEGVGIGGEDKKEDKKVSDPLMDLFGSLMNTVNRLYPDKSKKEPVKEESVSKTEDKVMKQMGLSEKDLENKPKKIELEHWNSPELISKEGKEPELLFKNHGIGSDNFHDYEHDVSVPMSYIGDLLENYMTDEEWNSLVKEQNYDEGFVSEILNKYLDKALSDYYEKNRSDFVADYFAKEHDEY